MLQCARERDVTKLRQLLKAAPHSKEKLNEHDREGLSPLHYAARYDRFASVVVLVKAGAGEIAGRHYYYHRRRRVIIVFLNVLYYKIKLSQVPYSTIKKAKYH